MRFNKNKPNTGGPCKEGENCHSILEQLEEIDDEADEHGIHLVTTEEVDLAKRFGITSFPTLAFFRNQDPLIYKGMTNKYY
jgi:thiol-disulfide isomerase/thioredoxin